jgi:hypothetical protein
LRPHRIKEYQVQFRPFELAEIKGIVLNPRSTGNPSPKTKGSPHRPGPAR